MSLKRCQLRISKAIKAMKKILIKKRWALRVVPSQSSVQPQSKATKLRLKCQTLSTTELRTIQLTLRSQRERILSRLLRMWWECQSLCRRWLMMRLGGTRRTSRHEQFLTLTNLWKNQFWWNIESKTCCSRVDSLSYVDLWPLLGELP